MKAKLPASLAALYVAAIVIAACSKGEAPAKESPVARGKYLVSSIGCADCHTPLQMGPNGPEPDLARQFSGHPAELAVSPAPAPSGSWIGHASHTMTAWAGPWGVSYTANLTPDPETGLGTWDAETFVKTIRTARHEGHGRELLPPMPAQFYRNLTDDDLKAMFAYLQSVPAIKNRVPQPLPPAAHPAPPAGK